MTLARSRQDLGTSLPRVSRDDSALHRRPWPYCRRPPAAVAAVISLCRRRRRPRVCPSSELLLRGSQTTPLKTARWHAAFYPGIVVSSTPRRHTPRRASRRRRHSFDCGGWAQQGVTIGVPSGYHHVPTVQTARALGYRACLRLDHAHAQVIVLPEDAILLVACGAKVCGGRLGQRGSREAPPVPSALSGALARGSVARRRLEPQGGQLCCCQDGFAAEHAASPWNEFQISVTSLPECFTGSRLPPGWSSRKSVMS